MMTKKKSLLKRLQTKTFKSFMTYFCIGALTLLVVSLGSIDKNVSGPSLSLDVFAKADYRLSVDQVSGLYVVADVSDAFNLASASDVASNFVIATTMNEVGQSATGKREKPVIANIVVARGVTEYHVQEGESMESIAAKYHITTDQIRWSNGKKTTAVSAGETLYLPSSAGIVYTVKSGDTLESISQKYGSSPNEIAILNDLEISGISDGMKIFIKNGNLPERERPEYVPPAPRTNYTYTYLGNTSTRHNLRVTARGFFANSPGNPGVRGNCTWFAWYWRSTDPRSLGTLGREGRNARTWDRDYAYRGVGSEPRVGAVFQTAAGGGGYGHVGIVTGINADGSIEIVEMNYAGWSNVSEATIPAEHVHSFKYIY